MVEVPVADERFPHPVAGDKVQVIPLPVPSFVMAAANGTVAPAAIDGFEVGDVIVTPVRFTPIMEDAVLLTSAIAVTVMVAVHAEGRGLGAV